MGRYRGGLMSQYFAAMFRRRPNDGWFRVGRYDATTVDIMCATAVLTMFIYAASINAFAKLIFVPELVRQGEIWRLFTWPVVTAPNFFAFLGVIFFWVFGQQLEGLMGRNKFLTWVIAVTLIPAVLLTILGGVISELDFISIRDDVEFGLGTLFLCGIWVYAATYPNVRWFEVIPLWAIAGVFTMLNLLQYSGARAGGKILFLLFAIAGGLSVARSLGFATAWPIPHIPVGTGSGERKRRQPKPRKPRRGGGDRVVEGPWRRTGGAEVPPPPTANATPAEQAELDALLDKISDNGMDALSNAEKKRLNDLSKRLRNR